MEEFGFDSRLGKASRRVLKKRGFKKGEVLLLRSRDLGGRAERSGLDFGQVDLYTPGSFIQGDN